MKQVFIVGNLGADAEKKVLVNGKEIMRMSVAVTKRDKSSMWFGVVARYQEGVFPYLKKGRTISVIGDFDVSVYKGDIDLSIYADHIGLCGGANEDGNKDQSSQQSPAPTPTPPQNQGDTY